MNLINRDLQHVWHPCSHISDFTQYPPFIVERASGSYIYTPEGPLIDAISSWWCKSLGHGHPAVIQAIQEQLTKFEHVIGANTTYPKIVELSETLSNLSGKQHVFFASDGSSAVEIAMKLALHACTLKGLHNKNSFIALKNGYHGDTMATSNVSDVGRLKSLALNQINTCHFLEHIPYVSGKTDPLWLDCASVWPQTLQQLESLKSITCAIILEPIVQGSGGMLCYSQDFLHKLATWAQQNQVYLIADEIMTGLGRTGEWFAFQHAGITPNMICLSKGLTSGSIPLSCVLIEHDIYELCNDPHDFSKSFLHSHTYSGNPLAISAALATLKVINNENIIQQARELGVQMLNLFQEVANQSKMLKNIRAMGAIVAADLIDIDTPRVAYKIAQNAIKMGALLRPLGNTLYWLPPLNTPVQTLEQLSTITYNAIMQENR